MGRNVKIVRLGDLGKVLKHASATQSSHIAGAIHSSAKLAAVSARANAPVYNPVKWEHTIYSTFAHHKTPPGTLKRSIHVSKMISTDSTFNTGIYSRVRFASNIENGFTHHRTHQKIRGKRFMFKAVNVVFRHAVNRQLTRAVEKIFRVR